MPFPWKKARVSRFSRIVADLQSPNRGNSLVVETGFPTSLVDLFVKNRDRLKKSSKKKKKQRQQQELVISDPIPLSNSRDLVSQSDTVCVRNNTQGVENLKVQCVGFDRFELVSDLPVEKSVDVVNVNGNDWNENENGKRVLLVVLKIFIVVVLGLSTKKLAVGITMSAFVLIFLEYVGKHLLCFLKPCSNARLVLKPLIQRVFSFLFILKPGKNSECSKKELVIQEDDGDNVDDDVSVIDSCDLVETLELNSRNEEIQVVESNLDMVSRVEEDRRVGLLTCDQRWGCLDIDSNEGVVEVCDYKIGVWTCEKQRSRTAKIKTKIIKKLVPKKLRVGKKERKSKERKLDLNSEVSSCWEDDKLGRNEVLEEQESGDKQDLEVKGKPLLSQLLEEEDERENERRKRKEEVEFEFDNGISSSSMGFDASSSTGLQAKAETIVTDQRSETGRKESSGYLILFLIVLAGLLGGRMVALVFTVASCLMLKLVRSCRKLANSPINRSPASVSS